MNNVKELDLQIQKEHDIIVQLYAQIEAHENSIKRLKAEKDVAKEVEDKKFIDNWLNEHFGIPSQMAARQKSIFIVFYKNANFVKTIATGAGEAFLYAGPADDEDTLEYWLKENKLYAHRASSFCERNRSWYDLSLKEQLENLCWEFDSTGKLRKTQW